MTPERSALVREYRKQRQYYHAELALRAARVELAWREAEARGLVRLQAEPEIDCYDDSYIDTWDMSEGRKERAKKEVADRIDRDGHWILLSQFLTDSGEWETADSVGGFIGEDYKNSGYDVDLKLAALTAAGAETILNNLPRSL